MSCEIRKLINKYKSMPDAAKASLWFVFCGFLIRGISTITTPIFTRLMNTQEYGQYSVFNSWLEIITIFVTLRLGYGVYIQGLVKYSDEKDELSSSLLGLTTLLVSIVFVVYFCFRNFFNRLLDTSTTMMICMFLIIISTTTFDFWSARERNSFKYKNLVKLTIGVAIINPLMGIILVLFTSGNKAEARVISITAVYLFFYTYIYYATFKKGKKFYSKKFWEYGLKFNLPLVPHFLSQFILNHSDRLMISALIGTSEAGIYSLAYSIAAILSILNTSIENTLRPWVFQKIKNNQIEKIQPVSMIAIIVVALFNICLIAFSPEIVDIFAPKAYSNAVYIIPPVTMGIYFAFIYNIFVDVEMYYEKNKAVMIASSIGAIVNVVLNYLLIPIVGYYVAAYTTLLSYLLIAILHYHFMQKMLKSHANGVCIYNPKYILLISTLFLIIGLAFFAFKDHFAIRTVFALIISILIFKNRKNLNYKNMMK